MENSSYRIWLDGDSMSYANIHADHPMVVPTQEVEKAVSGVVLAHINMKNVLNYSEILVTVRGAANIQLDNCFVTAIPFSLVHVLVLINNRSKLVKTDSMFGGTMIANLYLDSVSFVNSWLCPDNLPPIPLEDVLAYMLQNPDSLPEPPHCKIINGILIKCVNIKM